MCTPPVVVIRESGLTTNELELELVKERSHYSVACRPTSTSVSAFVETLRAIATLLRNTLFLWAHGAVQKRRGCQLNYDAHSGRMPATLHNRLPRLGCANKCCRLASPVLLAASQLTATRTDRSFVHAQKKGNPGWPTSPPPRDFVMHCSPP